jgi:hypothetical protein
MHDTAATCPQTSRNQLKRRHERGFCDHENVHRLIDAAALAHVAYVIDGQPFCTPTLFWREGTRLYWHGSSASRMLRNLEKGEPASAKIRAIGVKEDEEDYALPIHAGRIPVRQVLGAPEPCPRLPPGVERPGNLAGYREGRLLEDVLSGAHARAFQD